MKRTSLAVGMFALVGCTQDVVAVKAHVRVAHLSPGAPDVDFCLAAHGSGTFTGPVLATAGRSTGLSYGRVTKYFDVDSQRYDVRLVAPGASDCTKPLAGLDDFTTLPELGADVSATIAAEGTLDGTGASAFALAAYIDDTSVDTGLAKLRFIHASPGTPSVDVGVGGGILFAPVFSNIAYGAAGAYVETAPLASVEIAARENGATSDVLSIEGANLPAGAIATAFAIGEIGNADAPLRVLLCVDNAEPNGVHSICDVVGDAPKRAHVRIAHLSPDTPPVDVCLAAGGTAAYGKPLFRTLGATGLAYPQVTTYVDLPAGNWDVRVVHAISGTCATPAIPDTTNLAVPADLTATVTAIGDLEPAGAAAGDPILHLAVFADDTTVDSGQIKLRFIHASPGTPMVDVGVGQGTNFTRVFANVSFGNFAVHPPLNDGYIQTAPMTSSTLSARVSGTTTDALVIHGVTLEASSISTAFAIGNKTGQAANPLQVLLCTDTKPTNGLLAACVAVP